LTYSVISSFLYVIYSYSGFYQVFYVLGEVATPRRTVPKASFFALGLTVLLFVLVNVSYFLVVPVDDYITDNRVPPSIDLAERFFTTILGDKIGRKVMCSLLVISVFGNLLTLSFVAGRVKQEIAKEGILPFSRFFAKGNQTPLSWLKARMTSTTSLGKVETERAPITGLFLHWITTMICIISTSWLRPSLSINIWVTLFGFSIRLIIPSIVSGSLIYLKLRKSCGWKEISAYNCGLIPAVVVLSVMMTVFWNGFAKSAVRFTVVTPYWILPFIALSSVLWGMFWWVGLKGLEWVRKEEMVATRTAVLDQRDNGEWVQVAEVVDIEWRARRAPDVESFETPKRDR
jgi:amino acid transporter